MATILDKTISRESSECVDERNIIVSLTDTQEISLKLKGLRGEGNSITIKKLYNQLNGVVEDAEDTTQSKGSISVTHDKTETPKRKVKHDGSMICIHELRSRLLVASGDDIPLATKVKIDGIIVNLINDMKNG